MFFKSNSLKSYWFPILLLIDNSVSFQLSIYTLLFDSNISSLIQLDLSSSQPYDHLFVKSNSLVSIHQMIFNLLLVSNIFINRLFSYLFTRSYLIPLFQVWYNSIYRVVVLNHIIFCLSILIYSHHYSKWSFNYCWFWIFLNQIRKNY